MVGFTDLFGIVLDDESEVERVQVVVQNVRTRQYWNGEIWVDTWEWNTATLDGSDGWSLPAVNLDQEDRFSVLLWAFDSQGNRSNWQDNATSIIVPVSPDTPIS